MVQELSKRAAEIHSGTVDASVDNMLCVTNDGRKIGLDVRLMNPMLPDDPNSKLNVCVQNVPEDLGGRQRPEADPTFVLRSFDAEKRRQL